MFTVDLALVDNWGRTAWDYARVRQLHYCMLIIASYIRQRTKYADTATDDDPSEQGDGVHVMGRRNAEENLGMGNLQVGDVVWWMRRGHLRMNYLQGREGGR